MRTPNLPLLTIILIVAYAAAIGPWSVRPAAEQSFARQVALESLPPRELARIQDDIRRMQRAIREGNCDTVLSLAHGRWIAAIGGREAMCREIKALAVGQNRAGKDIVFEEVAFRDEATLLRSSQNVFVIVPSVCA